MTRVLLKTAAAVAALAFASTTAHAQSVAIVNAHNKEFKKQGKKTTLQLIHDSNPGLKDTNLKVGQKIFIPTS